MSEIKRYWPNYDGCSMDDSADGAYVLYENYAALTAQAEQLRVENERLKAELSIKGEYGYSQQVVDTLAKERDNLQSQLRAATEREKNLVEELKRGGEYARVCDREIAFANKRITELELKMVCADVIFDKRLFCDRCPTCKTPLSASYQNPKHCSECGQKLRFPPEEKTHETE